MTSTLGLILGSAAIAAIVSSLINAIANWLAKRAELERQDMEIAFKMAQLKHDQLAKVGDWRLHEGAPIAADFWDPFMTVIIYRRAMTEFRKTGHWDKGEAELEKYRREQSARRRTER